MKLGYARVSTVGQDLETQKEKLLKQGIAEDYLYIEKKTGTTTRNREALKDLIKNSREGDIVYITKIDRLARSIIDLNNVMNEFFEKGVTVVFIDNNMTFSADAESNPMQKLLFNVLGAFAEFERDMIVNRTTEGKIRAQQAGKKLGRKGQPDDQVKKALQLMSERSMNKLSVSDIVKITGVPKATIYKKMGEF
ncbi:TetR family transcriptional regulator [Listeria monocytogenes]|uniref:recombinase family protein n=1 Tax=Listeria monocytogenes TaxID=1639 RepID=UPI0004D4758D|nr:recombinase family protein [Listeria monocytogenes]EAC3172718.1 TetR family transcriptional regulator [Listeria monocytogenes]EAC7981569.1 TetR family transcriptional regulator [Listeria monocytogenes]EAD1582464.1 TetR family transcriptional regulator [Listeria monocytogenes]EAD2068766.1 TetR family transcriptional regulator [Listeria monocytogenes]EAD2074963.1 TetR family transcriptional regulator [Listeria monocytogenes]